MLSRTFAHLSNLHVGRSPELDRAAEELCQALVEAEIDHIIVTGGVTDPGGAAEPERFRSIFRPLLEKRRVTLASRENGRDEPVRGVVAGSGLVTVRRAEGLFLVCVDAFGPASRRRVLDEIDEVLEVAPAGVLSILAMQHYPAPRPRAGLARRLVRFFSQPRAARLDFEQRLVEHALGRCDLILHGRGEAPSEAQRLAHHGRHVSIYGAGGSSQLQRVRIFTHAAGALLDEPAWLDSREPVPRLALPERPTPSTLQAPALAGQLG